VAALGNYREEIPVTSKRVILVLIMLVLVNPLVHAQSGSASNNNLCKPIDSYIVMGFFNGMLTSKQQANDNMDILEKTYGYEISKGVELRHRLFYNHTHGYVDDLLELFEQRNNENGKKHALSFRYELLWSLPYKGLWWRVLQSYKNMEKMYAEMEQKLPAIYDRTIKEINPKQEDYAEHNAMVKKIIDDEGKMLLIAHSQGNLFVNQVYDYAKDKLQDLDKNLRVIHVAPASVKTNGPHILADKDYVISTLFYGAIISGNSVPGVTHVIPPYGKNRPADPTGATDKRGHAWLPIYANPNLDIFNVLNTHINTDLVILENNFVNPTNNKTGTEFLAADLRWPSNRDKFDVHLQVYEPDGTRVAYNKPVGKSGLLRIKGTSNQYILGCNKSSIQTGIYQFTVNNTQQVKGDRANLKITSYQQGLISSKSFKLGSASNKETYVLSINIAEDAKGNLIVSEF